MSLHTRNAGRLRFLIPSLFLLVLPWSATATEEDAAVEQGTLGARIQAGYRAVSTEHEPGRAAEYSFLHSGPTFGVDLKGWRDSRGFSLMTDYLNEADYAAEAELNHKGLVRLSIATASMYHNLDHLPFDPANQPDAYKTPTARWIDFEERNPGDKYFVEVEQSRAHLRVKPASYPAHFNIDYWRLERSGRKQLRFVDHASDDPAQAGSCNQCHVRSRSRTLDRITEELKGSIDTHLGPVDVIVEQLYREFRDREPVPSDTFGSSLRVAAGNYQHDEDPDSRLIASTVKLHTSLSGGLAGAASFTVGKRENQSDLTDVQSVESETDFRKATGDLTWIPSPRWTFNFRYRLLDIDNSNAGALISASEASPIRVPDNIELTRASYSATGSYRPGRNWTIKGEFERRDIHRDNVGARSALEILPPFNPVWDISEDETINRYRIGIIARPLGGSRLKVNSWYQIQTSNDPAYAASADESHTFFSGASYSSGSLWGLTGSLKLKKDENDGHRVEQFNTTWFPFEIDRKAEEQNLTAGAWLNLPGDVSFGLNYGYLRSRIAQDLLFGSAPSLIPTSNFTIEDDSEYSQRVQTLSANATWQMTRKLQGQIEGHHIRSFAVFTPDFFRSLNYAGIPIERDFASSDGLRDISKLDIRQNGMRLGLNYKVRESWTIGLDYTLDDYEDRDNSFFDGTVQTYMASLARSW